MSIIRNSLIVSPARTRAQKLPPNPTTTRDTQMLSRGVRTRRNGFMELRERAILNSKANAFFQTSIRQGGFSIEWSMRIVAL